ncbi:putative Splicing factor 3B subunit 2 protein [Naja naja]|nr:putative Splicing factor 3B subunit 2 protein [Naja naja]
MASEGHSEIPKAGELPLPGYGAWSPKELQAKLAEIGAPTQGSREELLERLQTYTLQVQGIPLPPPPMGMPPMQPPPPPPPGMGLNFPMGVGPSPPPPTLGPPLRMQMDPSSLPEEERLKLAQQQAAMLIQQEERGKQAAVLMEQVRHQEMSKLAPSVPRTVPDLLSRPQGHPRINPSSSSPMGIASSRPRGPPPPPGEDSREIDDSGVGPKIPQALEKILQLKEIRQEELTSVPGAIDDDMETELRMLAGISASDAEDDASALSKKEVSQAAKGHGEESGSDAPVEIEYVTEEPEIYDPNFIFFKRIFEAFKLTDDVKKDKEKEPEKTDKLAASALPKKKGFEEERKDSDDSSDDEQEKKPEAPKLSKKKLRRMNRFTVAELKQLVARPDVVEMHDVTAQDPKLLVHLKATRNSVPVPRHWCFKRKYLQGKRGIEKPPFDLPEFIKRTGIQEMREALQEKEEQKTMKSKMREKVRPKMGKIDIDYQKLHDAFFKWQTKPKLTIHGDLYYENAHKVPPPWLIAMQRYGPPPSYPNLKIPGLNSPIPEGCSFGYHAGGWGKPPAKTEEEEIDRTPWGELEPSDEESSEEEEDEDTDEEKPDETGFITPADSGLITPGGFSSVPAGMETPELIELRKKKIEEAMDGSETPQLFTVLPEKRMPTVMSRKGPVPEIQGVEVALAPEELELDPMAMTQKYEEHVREQQAQVEKEDFSDMVAEHAAKQKQKKRKAQPQDSRAGAKKYKEFKF